MHYRAILFALGLAPDPDKTDQYEEARNFPTAYNAEEDPEVVEEAAQAIQEVQADPDGKVEEQPISEDEGDSDNDNDEASWEDEPENDTTTSKRSKKVNTSVDKVSSEQNIGPKTVLTISGCVASSNSRGYPPI